MDLFDEGDISGCFAGAFTLDEAALRELCEVSAEGHSAVVRALASELPIQGEIADFVRRILDSAGEAERNAPSKQAAQLASREAADRAATDRGERCVKAVLEAAFKVYRETDRLFGFLRFTPDCGGVYTAYCAPDHFTLPFLAEHFAARFGSAPWAIIDEKRNIVLSCRAGEGPRLHHRAATAAGACAAPAGAAADPWEGIWRDYHRAINIESRKNPRLQKQFMPERYRKYLSELKPGALP
ncbi:MAG: TIGR03915 family putative DNA repair protein [Treponema sp.]|jgi:probable DNA metabolism protein|nr:TIGR03915 family putative DNA repair protein [Treponema sp.]